LTCTVGGNSHALENLQRKKKKRQGNEATDQPANNETWTASRAVVIKLWYRQIEGAAAAAKTVEIRLQWYWRWAGQQETYPT
jgi:hypothetical protein